MKTTHIYASVTERISVNIPWIFREVPDHSAIPVGDHEKLHLKLAQKGYLVYDFFLPGLVIHALEKGTNVYILKWLNEIKRNGLELINMLGCHDGIPLLDLKGLLPDHEIQEIIDTVVGRGGIVKDLHGNKTLYYQVNATYFSALGEDQLKMLFARALQIFMPGRPQVWYLDLFSGKNDYQAVLRNGGAEHKEINRTNLSAEDMAVCLEDDGTKRQLDLLRFRNCCPAFGKNGEFEITTIDASRMKLTWRGDGHTAIFPGILKPVLLALCHTMAPEHRRFLCIHKKLFFFIKTTKKQPQGWKRLFFAVSVTGRAGRDDPFNVLTHITVIQILA